MSRNFKAGKQLIRWLELVGRLVFFHDFLWLTLLEKKTVIFPWFPRPFLIFHDFQRFSIFFQDLATLISVSIQYSSGSKGMLLFMIEIFTILVPIEMVFVINYLRNIPWNDIFKQDTLLLTLNFVTASRLELICKYLILNTRSSLIHFHSSQLVLILP